MYTHVNQQNPLQPRNGLELTLTNSTFEQLLNNAINTSTGNMATGRAMREIHRGKLVLLKDQIKAGVTIGKHDVEKGTELVIYSIDLQTDRVKTQIQNAYAKWLTEIGMEQKLEGIRAINTFSEKVEALKAQISCGTASSRVKERLQSLAELIVDDLFTLLFKEAAERLLLQENTN